MAAELELELWTQRNLPPAAAAVLQALVELVELVLLPAVVCELFALQVLGIAAQDIAHVERSLQYHSAEAQRLPCEIGRPHEEQYF